MVSVPKVEDSAALAVRAGGAGAGRRPAAPRCRLGGDAARAALRRPAARAAVAPPLAPLAPSWRRWRRRRRRPAAAAAAAVPWPPPPSVPPLCAGAGAAVAAGAAEPLVHAVRAVGRRAVVAVAA